MPTSFTASDICRGLRELRLALAGAWVQNVWDDGDRRWVMKFRTPGSPGRSYLLLLSGHRRFARLHLVDGRGPASPKPGPFCQVLRARFKGARLEDLTQIGGDRLVELGFTRPGGSVSADVGDPRRCVLVLHLFGALPDLLVLDHGRRVVASSLESSGDASRHTIGQEYSSPRRVDEASMAVAGADAMSVDGDEELAFQRLLAARFAVEESERALVDGRDSALRAITRERKRRSRTREKVATDLEGARSRQSDREFGELLKGVFGQMRRGMREIEVVDYFSSEMSTRVVPLDPRLDPRENVDRYFKRYGKAKRGVPILESRLVQMDEEDAVLARLETEVRECEDSGRLHEIEARLRPLLRRGRGARGDRSRRAKDGDTKAQGRRRFVSTDGWDILVGRNSRQNDELTLKIAHGNDVFLHVSGRPGAHVIVRARSGKSVPQPTLLEAAQLAVYHSLPARTAGALAAGATADVDYTQVKHVHKPKGSRPGAVLLASHKSLRIKLEEEVIRRLRRGGGGIDSRSGR